MRQSCYGDKVNHILINYQGDLYGCTARDFTVENRIGFLDKNGIPHYDLSKLRLRNAAKLSKPICECCRIAPICGGGCKQRAYESNEFEGCTMGYSDTDIDNKILDIFEYEFMSKKN